ncbi:BppU family phage baseplate upper protein [Lacticaseibacillus paracasei]|uniref:BppU family phage baseplate upper protein n=1 Tax=Lacticaseibacillus paracasei TaxID=1597 RepID=UPI003991FF43
MAIRTYKVTLDTKNAIAPEPVLLRQGDKTGAVVIDATLLDNGSPVQLGGLSLSFKANTADGKAFIDDSSGFGIVSAADGEFTYQVPSQLGQVPGKIELAYFSLSDANGLESTFNVVFAVSPAADMTQDSAKDWLSNLDDIINQYNQWVNDAHSSWEEFVNTNKEIIESIDPGGTLLTEVINARTPSGANAYPALGDRLDAGVDARSKNVKAFGVKGDGTTDDLAAIKKVIADAAPGDTLFFPAGSYKVSDNIQIDKRINIQGVRPVYEDSDLVRGTVIRGGGGIFFIGGASGTSVDGVGVVVAKGFTNGFDVHGTLSAITIKNCLTIAQAHGYLIESYLGLVDGVTVENCEAHDSIHGFISKATRTTFSQCLAENVSSWGFGVITDNIKGATNIGIAQDNKVINCRAIKAGYAYAQYRRNYFEDDASTVPCNGNQFVGCSNTDCAYGIVIGDPVGDTGNGKYTTYPVTNTTITNYVEDGGKFRANYSENLVLSGVTLKSTAEVTRDATHANKSMIVGAQSGQPIGKYDAIQALDSSATPDISFGHTFRSNNDVPTTITNLVGGRNGDQYTISLWDDYTTIDGLSSEGKIYLSNGAFHGKGNSITFKCQDGVFFEVNRTHILASNTNVSGETSPIDIGLHPFVDIAANKSMTMKPVHISNPELHDAMLTILIRSSNGTISPSGFDPTQFVVPDDLPMTSLNFGTGLLTQWAYLSAINKYILVSYRLAKYA